MLSEEVDRSRGMGNDDIEVLQECGKEVGLATVFLARSPERFPIAEDEFIGLVRQLSIQSSVDSLDLLNDTTDSGLIRGNIMVYIFIIPASELPEHNL